MYKFSSEGGDDGCSFRRGRLFALDFGVGGLGGVEGWIRSFFFEGPKIAFDASLSHLLMSKLCATSWSFSSPSSSITDSFSLLFDFIEGAKIKYLFIYIEKNGWLYFFDYELGF